MNIEWEELFNNFSTEDGGVKKIVTGISESDKILFDLENPLVYIMSFRAHDKFFSKSISFVTKSIYTHTAIAFRDDMHCYYEMIGVSGLREASIKDFRENRLIDVMGYPIDTNSKKRLFKLIKFFMNNKKVNYDRKSVLKILFKLGKYEENPITTYSVTDKDSFICSAFVTNILALVDIDLRKYVNKNKLIIDTVTPKEVIGFPKLKYLFSFNGSTGKREYLEDVAKQTKK